MPKDLFSQQALLYAQYRPEYPPELFDYILSFVQEKNTAWDCATGNGQAAAELARYFKKVYATDISEKQLQQARLRDNIVYSVAAAERTDFPGQLFDCITVAQAYHWFDFAAFQKEILRVAKPGAILAVWGYSLVICEEETIDRYIGQFYREVVGPYWDKERKHVDDHYATVDFPYEELPGKEFATNVQWTLKDLEGYLNTWSSVQHFIRKNNYNPVTKFCAQLKNIWKENKPINFKFPIFLKLATLTGNRQPVTGNL